MSLFAQKYSEAQLKFNNQLFYTHASLHINYFMTETTEQTPARLVCYIL